MSTTRTPYARLTQWPRLWLGIFSALLATPFALLVPRRRDWIAVIGREDGKFLDNSKYFFIEAALKPDTGLRVVQITERDDTRYWIRKAGLEALQFPSGTATWFLLRCGTVVADSIEWPRHGRRLLLLRARKIQLWHGVGFKRIELDKWQNEAKERLWMSSTWVQWARTLRKRLNGRIITYDAVATTSTFYRDHVFQRALRARHFPITGYPRNSFGKNKSANLLAWCNVDAAAKHVETWRTQGRRIVLVAPTYRDTRATPMGLDTSTLRMLSNFCATNDIELLFKFHPYERGVSIISGEHLHILRSDSDVYPLFPALDALVTDYSSIYMDFLYLDRPVFFLTPDLEQYVTYDRSIQFDYARMTPGPKLASWNALLDTRFEDTPEWTSRRAELHRLAFDTPAQGATTRLLDFMKELQWITQPNRSQQSPGTST